MVRDGSGQPASPITSPNSVASVVLCGTVEHDRAGGDARAMTDLDIAEDLLGARSDQYAAADFRMAISRLLAGAAERHLLQDRHVILDDRGLADHDAGGVIEEDAASDAHRWIDVGLEYRRRLALQIIGEVLASPAYYLQSQSSAVFQTDINPAVSIGRGIFLDHATGVVVGETAVIEDDVSILQEVTLGGTGKEAGDRHPKIRRGVLIGAGAKILGNIEIGHCARIAAGSVVLKPVPHNTTVAGVPARVIGEAGCPEPSRTMDHLFQDGDV